MADKKEELTEELEAARSELEQVKRETEALNGELESKNAVIAGLEQALAGRDSEIAVLKQTIAESDQRLADINSTLAQTVASYKDLAVAANPGVPAEMIGGDTVEAVDESLQNARALVDKVKQGMEEEASRTRVPFGAPQRAPLDLSVLSPREKIQYAIGSSSSYK